MKTLKTLVGAALIAVSSAALAVEPVEPIALNDAELDGVTAGIFSIGFGNSVAVAGASAAGLVALTATNATSASQVTKAAIGPFDLLIVQTGGQSDSFSTNFQ